MPSEKVLNLPLSGDEIVEILLQRIEKRMRADCFLHPASTYNGFSYDLTCNIKLKDMNFGKDTLVWDQHKEGEVDGVEPAAVIEKFDSGDSPNRTRLEHDLEIPVETVEGRNKVIRKRKFPKEK